MSDWLQFWTAAMLISSLLFLAITLVVAVGGLSDLRTMLRGFSQGGQTKDTHGQR